ncbi:MAG: hypothetical protein M1818_002038 [Claussenomyces sp. TS43310]|nr:MAG: hypothetical protein M1818_002038 [Claussenomyces sp. TS43310]
MAGNGSSVPRARAVAVFCGAKAGRNPAFIDAARSLASALHSQGWSLVYGGGSVGMMGEVARTLVGLGGIVQGIIPEKLLSIERARAPALVGKTRESSFGSLTIVEDMHARKALMAELSDAFVALPGGFGTLEELMEIITWNFLGIHEKPIILFNVDGYYDEIVTWVKKAVTEEFVNVGNRGIVVEAKSAAEVIEQIKSYKVASDRYDLDWGTRE